MTSPSSSDAGAGRAWFRFTVAQLLWLALLCALASGFVARVMRSSEVQRPLEMAFSPDGRLLAAYFERGGIRIWDVSQARARRVGPPISTDRFGFPTRFSVRNSFRFVAPGTICWPEWDRKNLTWSLRLRDVKRNKALNTVLLPSTLPQEVAFSPDGRFVAAPSEFGRVRLIDTASGKQVRSFRTALNAYSVAFSDDGTRLVALIPGEVLVFDVESGRRIAGEKIPGGTYYSISVSPGGRHLALCEYVDTQKGTTRVRITRLDGTVELRFDDEQRHPEPWFLADSDRVALANDRGVQVWDIPSRKLVRELALTAPEVNDVVAAPDGKTLAVAERDRISLWNLQTGEHLADVWSRNALLEAFVFSLAFIGWAVVWGLMRRRSPATGTAETGPPADATGPFGRQRKPLTFRLNIAWLVFLLLVGGTLAAVPAALVLWQSVGGGTAAGGVVAVTSLLLGPPAFFVVVVLVLVVKKRLLHSHAAELRRAVAAARAPCRVTRCGPLTAYFFGAPTLEAIFEEEVATAHRRLGELLGKVVPPPPVPVFCFATQQEFDDYVGRRLPLGGLYSPPWWARQIVLCERPAHSIAHPPEVLRTLLGYLLLWNHKHFRVPAWLTAVVNAHVAHSDDVGHLARVHRRLRVEFERRGSIRPLPHTLDDKQYLRLVLAREQREPFLAQLVSSDVCASLAVYLTSDADRRRRFRLLLQALTRRADLDNAFRTHFGCGLDQLMDDWLGWLRERIDAEQHDPALPGGEWNFYSPPPETVRRQILHDVVPVCLDPASDLDARCRAARMLGASGVLLAVEPLIQALAQGPSELQTDALWALEAIAGRQMGDDPAVWRAWLHEFDATACVPAPPSAEGAVEAILVDEQPTAAPTSETPTSETPTDQGASLARPAAQPTAQPLVVPPRALTACWTMMTLGGLFAIVLPSTLLFYIGVAGWPMFYYSLALGVFTLARGVGRQTRWLRGTALLQLLNFASFDPLNPLFGIAILLLSRTPRVRAYRQH